MKASAAVVCSPAGVPLQRLKGTMAAWPLAAYAQHFRAQGGLDTNDTQIEAFVSSLRRRGDRPRFNQADLSGRCLRDEPARRSSVARSGTIWSQPVIRHLIAALLIGVAIDVSVPASAQISKYPFCIQGVDNPGWSGCSFNTLQACQAAASGTEAECLSNPWYQADTSVPMPSTPDRVPMGASDPLPIGPPPE